MRRSTEPRRNEGRRGSALVELALMCPWIIFMFIAVFDVGIYSYAQISTANAARVAALYTSSSKETSTDSQFACYRVLEEMRTLQNIGSTATCSCTGSTCTAGDGNLTVSAASVAGPDGDPASEVTVTYKTIPVIPVPFLSKSQLTITRKVRMRI